MKTLLIRQLGLSATQSIAARAGISRARGLFVVVFSALALGGCSALPDKPQRSVMYDFGPGPVANAPATRIAPLPPIAIDDVTTPGGALDNMAVLYRLAYADAQQLRPYSQARWTMPAAALVKQRLRERFSERRAVFGSGDSAALNRSENAVLPRLLRLELEEFSHFFSTPTDSTGLIRMRATLLEITPAGEKLIAQRRVVVQQPAASSDAPGGVRALALATDAAIEEIDRWLQQAPGI